MIDHFEELFRSQDRSRKAKRLAALAALLFAVFVITAGAAMTMAFILTLVETS